ncbi:MAG: NUDIX domain-containing protein [Rubrobacteraceae bacterium]
MDYVAGFYFSECKDRVALIRKLKPEWQRGRLNGIGGKVGPGEKPYAAMVREFEEETGARVEGWRLFCTATTEEDRLHFFTTRGDLDVLYSAETEEVVTAAVEDIPTLDTIPNLRWLIPLALDEGNLGTHLDYAPVHRPD